MENLNQSQGGKEGNQEDAPKPLFKLTLMRHQEPYYKDVGHDLTPDGVEGAKQTGRDFVDTGYISEEDELYLLHSPKPRAEGTAKFVAEGAGLRDIPTRSIRHIRSSDFGSEGHKFIERVAELGYDQESIAEDHHINEVFYNESPEIIETNDSKKGRLYRSLEYLIRWFLRNESDKTPHVIAVSHFEIISHLIDDVFGVESFDTYNVPAFGEDVRIEAYATENINIIEMLIAYRDLQRTVFFDREKRTVALTQ